MTHRRLAFAAAAILLLSASAAQAHDPASCRSVRLSDPGWTDIDATNSTASFVLKALGYVPKVKTLSVQVGFRSMKNGDIDVFLGNWMPAQKKYMDDLNKVHAVKVLTRNLTGAKYTLAVPSYVAKEGVTNVKDLAAHAKAFGKKIYGIAPGAPGNQNIRKMIDSPGMGLHGWSVVASSEAGMLAEVARAVRAKKAIVFLAWAPHPMNTKFHLTYLSGGDKWFGANYGGAEVYTLARTGWPNACPNAARFFRNLKFNIDMENRMMGKILDNGKTANDAVTEWIKAHPKVLGPWLDGVTTFDGKPGLPAVKAALGL